ncbi:MAG: alkaline phosphatase, partial [Terrimicrobiaceae bacterium]
VSMLTGVGVQKHQIVWNEFEPEKGVLSVPTIFQIARERGLTTALFAAKSKFKTLHRPKSLNVYAVPENPSAESVARAFAAKVGQLKPNLCFIHFADPDTAGHNFGVNSPEKLQALADCDAALRIVRDAIEAAGLLDSSVIIVTADHGGHDRTPEENADRQARGEPHQPGTHGGPQSSDVVIPWIAWGEGVRKNHTITTRVVTYDTAATALWLLGIPVPEGFWGRPVTDAFEKR